MKVEYDIDKINPEGRVRVNFIFGEGLEHPHLVRVVRDSEGNVNKELFEEAVKSIGDLLLKSVTTVVETIDDEAVDEQIVTTEPIAEEPVVEVVETPVKPKRTRKKK
jgi:uncharacterized membrane protein YheB (UPF0754 family)